MDTDNLNDDSLIDKTTFFFSSIKNSLFKNLEKEEIINKDVTSYCIETNIFEDIKNKYFSYILKDNTEKEEGKSLIVINLSESEKTNFLNDIIQSSSEKIESIKESISDTLDNSIEKINEIKDKSILLSQHAGTTVVDFSISINEKLTELEIKEKLLSNLIKIDLIFIISALYNFKSKYRKNSKEFLALTALAGFLNLLNNSKHNPDNTLKILDSNELVFDDLFNNITFKSVVETTEPFIIMIPNGNYILLILKLFI